MVMRKNITGVVKDNKDPAKSGRIMVTLPSMGGDDYPDWVNPVWPEGWLWVPEVGSEVDLVLPEGVDAVEFASEVFYKGKVLDETQAIPSELQTNYPRRRGFKTKAGHILIVDDKAGTFTIKNGKDGITLEMDGKGTLHLGVTLGTDYILKGTKFNADQAVLWPLIATYLGAIGAAFTASATDSFLSGMDNATKTAFAAANAVQAALATGGITTYLAGAPSRLSGKVKTG